MMRMTHSGRTSPTELTFGSTDSWDTWQPYMAWMSTDSRWTFTKNNTTCKETTSKLIFYFFKYFFQLASVLVMFLFYIHFPICFASWVLWRLPTTEKTDQLSFHISHMIFFFFNKDAVLLQVPRVPDPDLNIPELQELCTSGLSSIKWGHKTYIWKKTQRAKSPDT